MYHQTFQKGVFMKPKPQSELYLTMEDYKKVKIIEDSLEQKITRKEAARLLGLSVRTVQRMRKLFLQYGPKGIAHGNRGKTPSNKIAEDVRNFYIDLYRTKYRMFNYSHAIEKMKECGDFKYKISYESLRKILREENLGKIKRRKPSKAKEMRLREARFGFMLQMDGSHHKWFGRQKSCLISLIDDATSKIFYMKFESSETTMACLKALKHIVQTYGVPVIILTDKAGWSVGGKRQHFSHFEKACELLGIEVIGTSNPESKGRIERSFKTHQDRLIAELEFEKIGNRLGAQEYVDETYLPEWNNTRAVKPREKQGAFRELPKNIDLDYVFSKKETRISNKTNLVNLNGEMYHLEHPNKLNLGGEKIEAAYTTNGELWFYHNTVKLAHMVRAKNRSWKRPA